MNKNRYNAILEINPEQNFMSCQGTLTYNVKQKYVKEISFYLYKDFIIDEIGCSSMEKYIFEENTAEWCPFVTESRRLVITLKTAMDEGQQLEINFRYHGKVELVSQWEINRITGDFIELGIYAPWFPLTQEMEETLFYTDVIITDEYQLISTGRISKISSRLWRVVQDVPGNDCTIISGRYIKNISAGDSDNIRVYYFEEEKVDICREIYDTSVWLREYYTQRFGEAVSGCCSIVVPKREIGGGYCRPGLVVLAFSRDSFKVDMRFLGHEIAHLWWNKAQSTNSWEDWLNESFAEYSALMAVRDKFGEGEFQRRIGLYMDSISELPPIMGLSRGDEKAYQVLYKKGPVILYKLELMAGKEKFESLLGQIHLNNIGNTRDLLELVGNMLGIEYLDYIREELQK